MNKKITAFIMTFVMMFTVMGVTAKAEAASIPFMTVESGVVKEKVGNHYIWVKDYYDEEGATVKQELRVAKKANGKGTILKTVKSPYGFNDVISNGQTIYYCVDNWDTGVAKIYKTKVTGGKHTVFRTLKNIGAACGPVTVYGNRLYYYRDAAEPGGYISWNLYSVTLNNKNLRLEKAGVVGQSGYGRYITCDNEFKDMKTQLYDVKTRKSTQLIKSWQSRVYNGNIYYGTDGQDGAYVKKSNLAGKNITTVGKVKGATWYVNYLGKNFAHFENYETNAQKRVTYATKKIVKVK